MRVAAQQALASATDKNMTDWVNIDMRGEELGHCTWRLVAVAPISPHTKALGVCKHILQQLPLLLHCPAVHKLGHFGYMVKDFDAQVDFYARNFNLAPTDFLYVQTEGGGMKEVVTFMHVDRGEDPTDHHTLFFGTGENKRTKFRNAGF